jgi:hypothetical protein
VGNAIAPGEEDEEDTCQCKADGGAGDVCSTCIHAKSLGDAGEEDDSEEDTCNADGGSCDVCAI